MEQDEEPAGAFWTEVRPILKSGVFWIMLAGGILNNAASYGLRKMRGRMKKMAVGILKEGLKQRDGPTREVCRSALELLGEQVPRKSASRRQAAKGLRIREIVRKSRPRGQVGIRRARG
jgi:hypothetical protein